jgi:signal transduction histidine kinase
MTTHHPARRPRPHWRHFVVNIVSPAILTFALFFSLIFAVIIPTMKKNIIERKKEMIRQLTQAAWSELAGLQEQEKQGALSHAAAQQAAIARIQNMRYGDDGKDYFWISDTQTRMVMHPYRTALTRRRL